MQQLMKPEAKSIQMPYCPLSQIKNLIFLFVTSNTETDKIVWYTKTDHLLYSNYHG